VDVGLYFDLRNPPRWEQPWSAHYGRALELVEQGEELGASTVWLSEHHFFSDGYLPQPLVFAAAVAARTKRIDIGTAVLLPTLRHVLHLAEEVALVDILSGCRLQLGIGAGYRPVEHQAFEVSFGKRFSELESMIQELRQALSERVSPPLPRESLPIWGGFAGPRGAAIAGRLGLDLLALDGRLLGPYAEARRIAGLPPREPRMRGHINVLLADDPERAWALARPHFAWQIDSYNRHAVEGTGKPVPEPRDIDRLRNSQSQPGRVGVMTVDQAVGLVRKRVGDLPVDEVYFWATVANTPDELVDRHIELVCTELRSRLSELSPGQRASDA